jgi:hypothetical protein
MCLYYLEMSSLCQKLSLGADVEALQGKKMEPLNDDRYTNNDAARGPPLTAKHILLAPKLSNIPIRIPSGSVGTRQNGIVFFFKSNDDFLLTPICKHNTKELDDSPSASSTEAGSTLSPPKASASPSAADSYNKSMPADSKYSSLVAYVTIQLTSLKQSKVTTVATTSATTCDGGGGGGGSKPSATRTTKQDSKLFRMLSVVC